MAFETATSISRRTGLSKATVVRFISRLGYDGFADFQERLKNEFMDLLESPINRFTDKHDPNGPRRQGLPGQHRGFVDQQSAGAPGP